MQEKMEQGILLPDGTVVKLFAFMDDELRVVTEVRNGWMGEEECEVKDEEVVRGEVFEGTDERSTRE